MAVSLKFLDQYLDWGLILQEPSILPKLSIPVRNDSIPVSLIDEMALAVNFDAMAADPLTPDILLYALAHRFNFRKVLSCRKHLDFDFIRNHFQALRNCTDLITTNFQLTESQMEEFHHLIDFNIASETQKMSPAFILKNKYYVNWDKISMYQDVTPEFVEKYRPKF